jgi:excisionase family DNA binding protein
MHDACLYSGLGRSSIYELISAGRLRSVKIGSRRLILREDLDALMKSGRQGL